MSYQSVWLCSQFCFFLFADRQDKVRLGLGLVTLSALSTAEGETGTRAFSVLNEQQGWSVALQVFRPSWWPDKDPLTDKTILPE
jgi:hypothetical protein